MHLRLVLSRSHPADPLFVHACTDWQSDLQVSSWTALLCPRGMPSSVRSPCLPAVALALVPLSCIAGSSEILTTLAPADLEGGGAFCYVQDLGSKNRVSRLPDCCCLVLSKPAIMLIHRDPGCAQTHMERQSGSMVLQGSDRYSLSSGDTVRFGSVRCRVSFGSQVRPRAGCMLALAARKGSLTGDACTCAGSPA